MLFPWDTAAVAIIAAPTTGLIYTFSTYSNALETTLNLSLDETDTVGIALTLVGFVTFTCGQIMDRTSVWFCCLLGGCLVLVSYSLFGFIALGYLGDSKPVWALTLLNAAGAYGSSFMVSAVFTVLTKNFRGHDRVNVICIAKAWVGLGSGLSTGFYLSVFPSSAEDSSRLHYLFFLALVGGLIPILVAPILRPLSAEVVVAHGERRTLLPWHLRVSFGFAVTVALIAVTLTSSLVKSVPLAITILVIFLSPLLFTVRRPVREGDAGTTNNPHENRTAVSPWACGPGKMLRHPEFYLLWFCAFCLQGGGIFMTTNLGSIANSRPGPPVTPSSVVTIFSCSQSLARLVTGWITNRMMRFKLPRTAYFPVLLFVMAAGQAMCLVGGPVALVVGVVCSGWGFGSCFPMLVLTVGDVFGPDRFSSNYMLLDGMPGAVGSFLLAKLLAQSVYNAHSDGVSCTGLDCFAGSHVVVGGIELVGCTLAVVLAFRTHKVYRTICGDGNDVVALALSTEHVVHIPS